MTATKIPPNAEVMEAFKTILSNSKDSKEFLRTPSAALAKVGLKVADPSYFDEHVFTMVPALKPHMLAGAVGKEQDDPTLGCSSPGCVACQAGLAVSLTVLITSAFAAMPEAAPIIAEIAEVAGVSAETLTAIFSGTSSVTGVISGICIALGDCSA